MSVVSEAPLPEDATLRQALLDLAHYEANNGASLFYGKPDRWWDALHHRCRNGHVSTRYLKSEKLGPCCLASNCRATVFVTFPEDRDGPLPTVEAYPRILEAIQAGRTRVVLTIHEGTDVGIFGATLADMLDGSAMTGEEAWSAARETVQGNACRIYDFGNELSSPDFPIPVTPC